MTRFLGRFAGEILLGAALAGALLLLFMLFAPDAPPARPAPAPAPAPTPQPDPTPSPCPGPGPCPGPRPCPGPGPCPRPHELFARSCCDCGARCQCPGDPCTCTRQSAGQIHTAACDGAGTVVVGGPTAPDGKTQVQCDLPTDQLEHNVGGRDGAGLCVFTSIEFAAKWQHEKRLDHFQQQMRQEPGGGYPQKVDAMITKYGPGTPYVQYEGPDDAVLRLALATGRMAGVTYNGHDPHYRGSIAHMVDLVYYDGATACIRDNNFVAENELVWLSGPEFLQRWKGGGQGWAVVLLAPPPPPPPAHVPQRVFAQRPTLQLPTAPEGPPVSGYSWRTRPDDPGRLYLWRDGLQVGGYDVAGDAYRPYDPWKRAWGPEGAAPAGAPLPAPRAGRREDNYGIVREHLDCCRERWTLSGRESTREEAASGLTDDSRLLRLTVIGPDAERGPVLKDLASHPALAWTHGRCLLQDYGPDEWAVARCGFAHAGHPTVYLQRPDGHVLWRQDDYQGGPEVLAAALRRADPDYHPDRDPGPNAPVPGPGGPGAAPDHVPLCCGGGAALLLALLAAWRRGAAA